MATEVMSKSAFKNGRPYDPPKRTEALPKHSLFGAEIEHLDPEERKVIKELNLQNYQEKQQKQKVAQQKRYKASLPEHLMKKLPDVGAEGQKQEFEKRLQQNNDAQQTLDVIEEKSKFFQLGTVGDPSQNKAAPVRTVNWYDEAAIKDADKFNTGGARADKTGYNRDKYQAPSASHQYALIGDPIKLGMDFEDPATKAGASTSQLPKYKRHRAPDWLPKEAYMPKPVPEPDALGISIDIPANIRHQFGTKICRDVLKDRGLVDQTLEMQAKIRASSNKTRSSESRKEVNIPVGSPEYEGLSQVGRQNIFPGYTTNHKTTSMKQDYTKDVFNRRVPDPDQWRCQRDELTIWNEHKFIAQRLKQRWAEYEESRPKLQANWDRDAKRPPPQPKPPEPKAKPKPRPKRAKLEQTEKMDDEFPVIEFKTPPLTPPPPPPERIPAAENLEKDDAFWEFFDQPIPK